MISINTAIASAHSTAMILTSTRGTVVDGPTLPHIQWKHP